MRARHLRSGPICTLIAFSILALALSWWSWSLVLLNPDSVPLLPWRPLAAAFIVTTVAAGGVQRPIRGAALRIGR